MIDEHKDKSIKIYACLDVVEQDKIQKSLKIN